MHCHKLLYHAHSNLHAYGMIELDSTGESKKHACGERFKIPRDLNCNA